MAFARKLDLRAVPVVISDRSQLIPALRAGQGDVIVGSLAVTPERAEAIAFTRPVRHVAQQVVVPKADRSLKRPADLAGKTVTVRASSSYAAAARPAPGAGEGPRGQAGPGDRGHVRPDPEGRPGRGSRHGGGLGHPGRGAHVRARREGGVHAERARFDRLGGPQGEPGAQDGARRLPGRADADRLQGRARPGPTSTPSASAGRSGSSPATRARRTSSIAETSSASSTSWSASSRGRWECGSRW